MKQNNLTLMFVENVYLTTQVYKKIYILCIANSQQNEQDGNQTWRNTNATQTNDNTVVNEHVLAPHHTVARSHLFLGTFIWISFQPTL